MDEIKSEPVAKLMDAAAPENPAAALVPEVMAEVLPAASQDSPSSTKPGSPPETTQGGGIGTGEAELAEAKPGRLRTADIRKDDAAIAQLFEHGVYPYRTKMRRLAYEHEKALLQVELLKAQRWIEATGQKVIMLFEGRDAAGKGGTIKRFMEHLNPRMARVVALSKPTDRERSQWFFQRNSQAALRSSGTADME